MNPLLYRIFTSLLARTSKYLPDIIFLRLKYRLKMGLSLNLKNPQRFSEKLQWLKLNDRKSIYSTMVDKYRVKNYVANKIGSEYIIKTIDVWDNPKKINFDALPNQFVLKCNHNSSGLFVCKNKSELSEKKKQEVCRFLQDGLSYNFYHFSKEWPYKDVKPLIIAEEYMVDESGIELKDYKLFCFNGEPKFLKVDFGRDIVHHANYYSLDWNLLPFGEVECPPDINHIIKKPQNFERMVDIARSLAEGLPFVRIDLYNIHGAIKFGEITFYPAGGLNPFYPDMYDFEIGKELILSEE